MTLSKHKHDLSRKPRHALLINGHDVDFEVDTGSPFALIGENVWKNIGSPRLARSRIKLSAYGHRQISVTGECTVDVTCGSTVLPLPLVVVSSGASLLGLNWIQAFQLDINALVYSPKASAELLSADVHTVGVPTDLDLKKVIADHPSIFAPGLGLCTKAHLQPRDSVQPKFSKARPVPFSRINAVEKELQRLEDLNPWDRVHVNFAGPFLGSMWLLATDAHSKWPSVIRLANYPTTEIIIAGLDALFTIWGLPKTLVSDNGPQFASADFANWCRSNGIVHMTSAPFHSSSNGRAPCGSVQESDAAFCRGGRSGKRPGRKSILERVSQHSSQYYRKNTCRVDAGPPVSNSAVSAPAGSTARREEAAAGETSSSGQVLKWRSCLLSQLWRKS